MANTSIINGFRPVIDKFGNAYNGAARKYYKDTTAGILGIGDPVIRVTDSSDPQGNAEIVRATTGSAITGVIVGFGVDVTNLNKSGYMLAADVGYVWVADDPYLWFEVQENNGTLLVTNIGEHVNSVTALNANTTLGCSNYQIDSASVTTSATWRLERLVQRPNNAVGAYAKWLVSPALHTEINASALNLTDV